MAEGIHMTNDSDQAEEQRLRDRLVGRKEEQKLRERLVSRRKKSASKDQEEEERRPSNNEEQDEGEGRRRPRRRQGGRHHHRRRGGHHHPPPRGRSPYPPHDPYWRGPPPPPPPGGRGPPPPHVMRRWHGGGPPPPPLPPHAYDPYGRGPPPPSHMNHRWGGGGGRDSYSRSRSYSRSDDDDDDSRSHDSFSRSRSRSRSFSRSRSRSYSSRSSRSRHSEEDDDDDRSVSDRSRSSVESSEDEDDHKEEPEVDASLTKDQRTIFVSQLVMRADERDIRRYFRREVGCRVNEVIMLRDKRTGRHKGSAYVELGRLEDVAKAVAINGQAPSFQRFPILVKPSEAEKNYMIPSASSTLTASMMGVKPAGPTGPMLGPDGMLVEAQKAYVGNLDKRVTQQQIFTMFQPFGQLEKVNLQLEPSTGVSKGFAFLSYRDPKEANLAIQTMAGQMVAGERLKTGWANQSSTIPHVQVVTSSEFPDDAPARVQKAHAVLAQLTGSGLAGVVPASSGEIASTAEAAINAALGLGSTPGVAAVPVVAATVTPPAGVDPKVIGGADAPTKHLLVHNMFDKDQETEEGWEEEIRLDFEEECSKYGKIASVTIMSTEPGGKIYASFDTVDGAQTCASSLAGRWFDKRQLRVEFVSEEALPKKKD